MKVARSLFIVSLVALFIVCFMQMNKNFDPLARYPYADESNRDIIKEKLNTDDINYLISQQLKPEEFMPYIKIDGFSIRHTRYYEKAYQTQEADRSFIVEFINKYKDYFSYEDLELLLDNYSYYSLIEFYKGTPSSFVKDGVLISNPSDLQTLITDKTTVYDFKPKDLVELSIPNMNIIDVSQPILVREEVSKSLDKLCEAAKSINDNTCGDMILVRGYISFDEQIILYKNALLEYGPDNFKKYDDLPGQSEYELGTLILFKPANEGLDGKEVDESDQANWLEKHAHEYGFIVRYPKGKEDITKKQGNVFLLRYVGKEVANELYTKNLAFEEKR